MKVLLTKPAYLQVDLRFERRNCKSINIYYKMDVFFVLGVCIFTTVLRPAQIIVKMEGKSVCYCWWERYFTKSSEHTTVWARKQQR